MTSANDVYKSILEQYPTAQINTQFVGHDDVGTTFSAFIDLPESPDSAYGWGFFPGLDKEAFEQAEADALGAALIRLEATLKARTAQTATNEPVAATPQQSVAPATPTAPAQNVDSKAKEAAELLSLSSVPGTVAMAREEANLGPCKDNTEFANRAKALGFTNAAAMLQVLGANIPSDNTKIREVLAKAIADFGGNDKVLTTLRGVILAREGVSA